MSEQGDEREVEIKFDCDAAVHDELLLMERVSDFTVDDRRPRFQDDLYFDTADRILERAGASFRLRMLETGVLMTFESDRDHSADDAELNVASRIEDEVKLPNLSRDDVHFDAPLPANIDASPLRRARKLAPDGEFLPIAHIQNDRTILELSSMDGDKVEIAVDRCRATRLRDQREITFDGIEVESKGAGRETLLGLARSLQHQFPGLVPMAKTKLERTLT